MTFEEGQPAAGADEARWAEFTGQIASFCERLLSRYRVRGPTSLPGPKIIRDSLHGYHLLQPYEVELIDSPLLQRLRFIHQTAFAFHIYPSANHSRFEHSLGAAKLVTDVATYMRFNKDTRALFDESTVTELRFAALLHDVGHCLFSHLSELIIEERFPELVHVIKKRFPGRSTREVISYVRITSDLVRIYLMKSLLPMASLLTLKRSLGIVLTSQCRPLSSDIKLM